jgi:hypothetical protein
MLRPFFASDWVSSELDFAENPTAAKEASHSAGEKVKEAGQYIKDKTS